MNKKFKNDYFSMKGKDWKSPSGYIDILKSRDLRYIYYGRCSIESKLRIARIFFRILRHRMANKLLTEISFENIDGGLSISHAQAITVTAKAVLGRNISLRKGITIGIEARGKRKGAPVIGNNVWIGPNASVVGNITIGNDVLIAPNSYVNFNVPDHSIVIGNPAKIIPAKNGNATEGYLRQRTYNDKSDSKMQLT